MATTVQLSNTMNLKTDISYQNYSTHKQPLLDRSKIEFKEEWQEEDNRHIIIKWAVVNLLILLTILYVANN